MHEEPTQQRPSPPRPPLCSLSSCALARAVNSTRRGASAACVCLVLTPSPFRVQEGASTLFRRS